MEAAPPDTESSPRARSIGLGTVLIALVLALLAGLWLKTQPDPAHGFRSDCANGLWHGQQYTHLCYSDITPLLGTEQLDDGRLPYLDPCAHVEGQNCDEYPVLTMYLMRLAAWTSHGYGGFFYANAFWLALAAGFTAVCLYLLAGRRALWFALAPTLVVYGLMNWDLLAVALATAATLAFLTRRDVASGMLLGLGAAAKLYPALLVIPFAAERFRQRDPDRGIHLTWAAAGTWLAVNVPFALFGFGGWKQFFDFNAHRAADFDSLWYVGCHLAGQDRCLEGTLFPAGWPVVGSLSGVTSLSLAAFVGGTALVWWLRRRAEPDFPRWTLGFPVIVLFLLTSKVYSPQYGLWLLPWFALTLPRLGRIPALGLFAAFEVTDVAVFVTRFTWFNTVSYGGGGAPFGAFEVAILARTAVLVACLMAWTRGRAPELGGPAMAAVAEGTPSQARAMAAEG